MPVYPPEQSKVLAPGLIATKEYAAGSDGATFTTTSLTLVDVDAVNLKIDFIVPPSGKVLIKSSFLCREPGANNLYAGLRDSSGIVAGTIANVYSGISNLVRSNFQASIIGLTPGAALSYKLAFCVDAGTAAIWTGPTRGKVFMEVWDAAPTFSQAANQATANVMAPGLIGSVAYNPVSDVTAILTTTLADVDATNLFVTFIAPPSGKVLVKQSAYGYAAGGNYIYIALRDSSGNIANTSEHVAGGVAAEARWQSSHLVIGLTPGVSYTYKMAAKATVNTTCSIRYGSTAPYGAAVMEVWDAAPALSAQALITGNNFLPQSSYLAADITIAATLTLYDGPSLSLGPGTWLVNGVLDYTGPTDWFIARMWDGTTVYESHATYMTTSTAGASIVFPGTIITLLATTTIKLSAGSVSNSGGLIKSASPNYGPFATGTTGKTSKITAIRLAA